MANALSTSPAPRPSERVLAMGPHRRLLAYEDGELTRAELTAWAALFPEEVPTVNDELPWIVSNLE